MSRLCVRTFQWCKFNSWRTVPVNDAYLPCVSLGLSCFACANGVFSGLPDHSDLTWNCCGGIVINLKQLLILFDALCHENAAVLGLHIRGRQHTNYKAWTLNVIVGITVIGCLMVYVA